MRLGKLLLMALTLFAVLSPTLIYASLPDTGGTTGAATTSGSSSSSSAAYSSGECSTGGCNIFNCKELFSSNSTLVGGNLAMDSSSGGFPGLLGIALILILLVFSILGLIYMIGFAFHIDKFITFVKSEYMEGFANLVIIAVVAVGISASFGAINFITHIGSLSGGNTATNSNSIYVSLCNTFQKNIFVNGFVNFAGIYENLVVMESIATLNVADNPAGGVAINLPFAVVYSGGGWAMTPFYGLNALRQNLWLEQGMASGVMVFGVGLIMLLFVIYFLFPLFLYAGIVLRSFPWTRAVGGSLVSMFIAFYIMFPAVVYSFAAVTPANTNVICNGYTGTALALQELCSPQAFLQVSSLDAFMSQFLHFDPGAAYFDNVKTFADSMAYVGLQFVGVIIALIISYDLLEYLGDVLGAPSLQGQRLLSKVL